MEFEADHLPIPNWQFKVGTTDARVKESVTASDINALLDSTPHNGGSLWTRYNFTAQRLKGLGVGPGLIYVGARNGNVMNVVANSLRMSAYTRTDVGIYYSLPHVSLAVNVANVLDRAYIWSVQPGDATRISPGEPRKVTFSARYAF